MLRHLRARLRSSERIAALNDTHGSCPNACSDYIFFVPTRARRSRAANANPAITTDLTRARVNPISNGDLMSESLCEELSTQATSKPLGIQFDKRKTAERLAHALPELLRRLLPADFLLFSRQFNTAGFRWTVTVDQIGEVLRLERIFVS